MRPMICPQSPSASCGAPATTSSIRRNDCHCCGQPFDSKGHAATADAMTEQLEQALRTASDDGRLPIVFDTSPCAYRMKQALQDRLPVFDLTEFLHDHVLPRLKITRAEAAIAVHPVCSVRKMGLESKLESVARACSSAVTVPNDVTCCGWRATAASRSRNSMRTRCATFRAPCPRAAPRAIRAAAPARSG